MPKIDINIIIISLLPVNISYIYIKHYLFLINKLNIISINKQINNLYYLFIKVFKPNNNFINIINYKDNNINL